MTAVSFNEQFPSDIHERLKNKDRMIILDVREQEEWESGHIPNAKHIPLNELPERLQELDRQTETVVVCRSGGRSSKACEFLAAQGYNVTNMNGGMNKWYGEVETGKST
ncbi:rhodanese-like domain-containing protein [Brevibacillus fulvus]|uniref:Rhodanese-related sulfurtransferase n=1 Tax=Brevibacillus fulvus TaxID=1125967 RepID=A0A938XWI8_9BACL|nr:rhodanese-like domain-containing protein [Brevibacillus fulvus]MBM7588973.1 rhodanese-related sulfurtransferase [Brevibacillus fulvus]